MSQGCVYELVEHYECMQANRHRLLMRIFKSP